jgi:hypothetical protein
MDIEKTTITVTESMKLMRFMVVAIVTSVLAIFGYVLHQKEVEIQTQRDLMQLQSEVSEIRSQISTINDKKIVVLVDKVNSLSISMNDMYEKITVLYNNSLDRGKK